MAIVDSAIKTGSISSLNELDFVKVTEKAEPAGAVVKEVKTKQGDGGTATSTPSKPAPKPVVKKPGTGVVGANTKNDASSFFSKESLNNIKKTLPTPIAKKLGKFDPNTDCNDRNNNVNGSRSNDRSLVDRNPNDCNLSPINDVIVNIKSITINNNIISTDTEKKLDKSIIDSVKKTSKNLNGDVVGNLTNNIKSNLAKEISSNAATIKSKSIINKLNKLCSTNANVDFGNSSLFNISLFSGLLDGLKCKDPKSLRNLVFNVIGIGGDNGKDLLKSSLKSVINDDNSVIGNLAVVKDIKSSVNDVETNVTTKGLFGSITDSLNNTTDKDSTIVDYSSTITILDDFEPGWKKDELGQVNYFKLGDNEAIASLTNKEMLSKESTFNTSGVVNSSIDQTSSLAILNQFNQQNIA